MWSCVAATCARMYSSSKMMRGDCLDQYHAEGLLCRQRPSCREFLFRNNGGLGDRFRRWEHLPMLTESPNTQYSIHLSYVAFAERYPKNKESQKPPTIPVHLFVSNDMSTGHVSTYRVCISPRNAVGASLIDLMPVSTIRNP